ncbi:hypothetical protein [Sphingomonas ginsenosidivorax]|uniref:hypothetical protein n=1 Tax=Sphingomonas ginsenosidivorax TaxID=862135 RepID=UPI0018F480E2|nr:hypothetical protein [Sphingomonas ginsenosidivorax]
MIDSSGIQTSFEMRDHQPGVEQREGAVTPSAASDPKLILRSPLPDGPDSPYPRFTNAIRLATQTRDRFPEDMP